MQIFVDLDGVLADFDRHYEAVFGIKPDKVKDNVDWSLINSVPGFYADIPPMGDAMELWDFVNGLKGPKPAILTGIPKKVSASDNDKRRMIKKHFGNPEVICCASKNKSFFARAGDVLIDDWDRYRNLWVAKGGVWITHTSAENSISKLLEMGVGF